MEQIDEYKYKIVTCIKDYKNFTKKGETYILLLNWVNYSKIYYIFSKAPFEVSNIIGDIDPIDTDVLNEHFMNDVKYKLNILLNV